MISEQEILEKAQEIFRRLTPYLCVDNFGKRDPYYLDNPERSHTMIAFIEGGSRKCLEKK